jgi:hypothetical protein
MACDILDRFGIHPQNDTIGDESFPGGMVGDQFPSLMFSFLRFMRSETRMPVKHIKQKRSLVRALLGDSNLKFNRVISSSSVR